MAHKGISVADGGGYNICLFIYSIYQLDFLYHGIKT